MASSARPIAARPGTDDRPESDPLRRVQRGEMSIDEYLDERTERALEHVRGKVSDGVLATVREALREQLRTDPVLVELVRQATGHDLAASGDETRHRNGSGEKGQQ